MIKSASCIRLATGMTLIAGIAVLSGCGPAPFSRTSTTEQTTTTTPAPVVSTETITTQQNFHDK